ncbi:hypothetical protein DFS34DRAFT_486008 [Phlyctochytrium arcticum]|nr:hypothetical protein DFS34DRAFT_486008 [Phlyctochytrium arcticum]
MADQVLVTSSSAKLEPFVLLAKNVKGAAAVQLICDTISAPNVFVFSELLELPNVQELKQNPQHAPYVSLLELFAYGTYQDYKQQSQNLPPLTDSQLRKLKHLSIVTFSNRKRTLDYDVLLANLDIFNVRELEDLIIDAIYQDLLRGKLDQKKKCLEVEYAMGRDLAPGQLDTILSTLNAWASKLETVLASVDKQMKHVQDRHAAEAKEKEAFEKFIETSKRELRDKGTEKHPRNTTGDFVNMGDSSEDNKRAWKSKIRRSK